MATLCSQLRGASNRFYFMQATGTFSPSAVLRKMTIPTFGPVS